MKKEVFMPNTNDNVKQTKMPWFLKVVLAFGVLILVLGAAFTLADIWRELFTSKEFYLAVGTVAYLFGGFFHYNKIVPTLREICYCVGCGFISGGLILLFINGRTDMTTVCFFILLFGMGFGVLLDSIGHYIVCFAQLLFFYIGPLCDDIDPNIFYVSASLALPPAFLAAFLWRRRVSVFLLFLMSLFLSQNIFEMIMPYRITYLSIAVLTFWAVASEPKIVGESSKLKRAAVLFAVFFSVLLTYFLSFDQFWKNFNFIEISKYFYFDGLKCTLGFVFLGFEIALIVLSYLRAAANRGLKFDWLHVIIPLVIIGLVVIVKFTPRSGAVDSCDCHGLLFYRDREKWFFWIFNLLVAFLIYWSYKIKSVTMTVFCVLFSTIFMTIRICVDSIFHHTPDGTPLIYAGSILIYTVACYFIVNKKRQEQKTEKENS